MKILAGWQLFLQCRRWKC